MASAAFQRFLKDLTKPAELKKLTIDSTANRSSPALLKAVHDFNEDWYNEHKQDCKRSGIKCFLELVKEKISNKNYRGVIDKALLVYRATNEMVLNTLSTRFTEFNNMVKAKFGDKSAQHIFSQSVFGLTDEEKARKTSAHHKVVKSSNENQLQVDEKKVLAVLHAAKTSDVFEDKMIAVALAVGSRMIEILHVSEYHDSKYDPHNITIKGLAKDRRKLETDPQRQVQKPILELDGKDVTNLVNAIRSEFADKHPGTKASH